MYLHTHTCVYIYIYIYTYTHIHKHINLHVYIYIYICIYNVFIYNIIRKKKSTAQPLFIYRRLQEIQEESGSSFHTLLLDWEQAFDKVDQARMIRAIRRLGSKEQMKPSTKNPDSLSRKETPPRTLKDNSLESGKDAHCHLTSSSCYSLLSCTTSK